MPHTDEIKLNRTEKDELVARMTRVYLNNSRHYDEVYDEIEDGYNYLSGNQYTKERRQWYETFRRPTKVFNVYFNIFNNILGDFFLNDQRVKVHGYPGANESNINAFQDLIDVINMQNESPSLLSQGAAAGLNKVGYFYPRWSAEREETGSVVISNPDEFEIINDAFSTSYFFDDGNFQIRSRMVDIDKIMYLWPHHRKELKKFLKMTKEHNDALFEQLGPDMQLMMHSPRLVDQLGDRHRVLEFHEMSYEDAEIFINLDTGESDIWLLTGAKADFWKKLHPNHKIITRKTRIKKVAEIIPSLNFLLSYRMSEVQDKSFDYVPFSAYSYGKKSIRNFGIFKNARDPQDDHNEWRNITRDLMNKHANPALLWKPEHVKNKNEMRNFGRVPGASIEIEEEADLNDVYKLLEYSKLPFAPNEMSQEAIAFMEKVTGVTLSFQGFSESNSESGILFDRKLKQAAKTFIIIHRNWNRTRRRLYNKVIKIAQMNYPGKREFTHIDPVSGNPRKLVINSGPFDNIHTGEYQVVPDDEDKSPTARALRFIKRHDLHTSFLQAYGPTGTDPRWLLQESDHDLGDTTTLVERAEETIEYMRAQMAAQAAQSQLQNQIATAKELLALEDGGGIPGQTGPAPAQQ